MKKAEVVLGMRVAFEYHGERHAGMVTRTDTSDVEQVHVGNVVPPIPGGTTITLRAADLTPVGAPRPTVGRPQSTKP